MTLVDANILIDVLRSRDPAARVRLAATDPAICGIVTAELLQGVRSPAERNDVLGLVGILAEVAIPDSLWVDIGDNLALLRSRGVNVPFQDVVLATLSIASGYEVWTHDKHFPLMQTVLPDLRLFPEPP